MTRTDADPRSDADLVTTSRRLGAAAAGIAVAVAVVIGGGATLAVVTSGGSGDVAVAPPSTAAATTTSVPATSTTVAVVAPPAPTPVAVTSTSEATAVTTSPETTVPPPPVTEPARSEPPGQVEISGRRVDFGSSATTATVTLTNVGGRTVDYSIGGLGGGFSATPAAGTLAPGASVPIVVTLDRAALPEGPVSRTVSVASSGAGGGTIDLVGSVDLSPLVQIVEAAPDRYCPAAITPTIRASVTESSVESVVLSWSGPGTSGSTPMTNGGTTWSGSLPLGAEEGTWTYRVTATDGAGHIATATAFAVVDCPIPD